MVYMLKYDTTFGRFPRSLDKYYEGLIIDWKKVPVYSQTEAVNIPWKECGAEYIVEATGAYVTTEKSMDHIKAGAKKVIISAPAKDKVTPTFVYGVNHNEYKPDMQDVYKRQQQSCYHPHESLEDEIILMLYYRKVH